mgnify:CR=1 FL=1
MAIEWSDTYATGIEHVDNQHKELFKAVDRLLSACGGGKGKEEVSKLMDFLKDYVITHFSDEEELQKKHGYPKYLAHKKLHDDFISGFGRLMERFDEQGPTLSIITSINKTVVDWLINHIGQADKEMGKFIKEKNR